MLHTTCYLRTLGARLLNHSHLHLTACYPCRHRNAGIRKKRRREEEDSPYGLEDAMQDYSFDLQHGKGGTKVQALNINPAQPAKQFHSPSSPPPGARGSLYALWERLRRCELNGWLADWLSRAIPYASSLKGESMIKMSRKEFEMARKESPKENWHTLILVLSSYTTV
jgi:hypothetical protein